MSKDFNQFINDGWNKHASESEFVASELVSNVDLLDTTEKIPQFVALAVHVFGGHLGRWQNLIELLQEIKKLNVFENNQAVYRALATAAYCTGDTNDFNKYSRQASEEGSLLRIYAACASELVAQKQIKQATKAFHLALSQLPDQLPSESPIARSIAIAANNLACELEEFPERSEEEKQLMLLAAETARTHWEIAGTWLEVERAEYRLASSNLIAGNFEQAFTHAMFCLDICQENQAEPFEIFFAYEILTKICRQACVETKDKVKPEWQSYCTIP